MNYKFKEQAQSQKPDEVMVDIFEESTDEFGNPYQKKTSTVSVNSLKEFLANLQQQADNIAETQKATKDMLDALINSDEYKALTA